MDPAVLERIGRAKFTKANLQLLAEEQVAGAFRPEHQRSSALVNERAASRVQANGLGPDRTRNPVRAAGNAMARAYHRHQGKKALKAAYTQARRDVKKMDPAVREAIGREGINKADLKAFSQARMNQVFRPEGQFTNVPNPQLQQNQIVSYAAQLQAQVQQLQEQLQQLREQNARLEEQLQQQTQNQQQPQNQTQNQAQQQPQPEQHAQPEAETPQPQAQADHHVRLDNAVIQAPEAAQPQPNGQAPAEPEVQALPEAEAQQQRDPAQDERWTRRFNGEAQRGVDSEAQPWVDDRAASNQTGEQETGTQQPAAEERVPAAQQSPAELESVTQSPSAGQPGYDREAAAANQQATTGVEVGQHSGMNAADKKAQAVDAHYRAMAGTTDLKFSSGEKAGADGQSSGERSGAARVHTTGTKRGGKEI